MGAWEAYQLLKRSGLQSPLWYRSELLSSPFSLIKGGDLDYLKGTSKNRYFALMLRYFDFSAPH